ncbi:cutinase family protein [soil metagenome]
MQFTQGLALWRSANIFAVTSEACARPVSVRRSLKKGAGALAASFMAMAALVVAPQALTPTASAEPSCPDIEVIFARGTDEPVGLGRVGSAFVDSLRGQVGGRSVGAYAVAYPATFDFLAAAGGANDASGHIQWMVNNCPNTRLVLGGYSQGAAIVDVLAAVPFPAIGFNAPLPPNVPAHIAALAVFGNPSTKIGLPLTVSPVYGARSIDLCNVGDPVCSSGDDIAAHSNYGPAGLTDQAAAFVAGLV